ncbi:MAG TPA: efflux RND transporter permease subunit, partial [Chromatiaceae bacterium]|nr:efflux RND transporter permease subunit [Chromatiaceae bacterium]
VTYDRSGLIKDAIHTIKKTLFEEMLVVSIIVFLFLMHARSALIPIITLPIAILLSFIPLFYQGLTLNIMSLGGIAVAIGAMVDASIVLIENIHKRLEENNDKNSRLETIVAAMQEVGPSVFFSLLIITVSFIPIFSLEASEGRLFKPLAFSKTYAMGFAAILAVTLTPALAALLIRGNIRREDQHPLSRGIIKCYIPIVLFVLRHRLKVIGTACLLLLLTLPLFFHLHSEFMPPLNEGTLLYMPTAPPGMSITEASHILQSMDRNIKQVPEVQRVFGKMGRADTATDPAPIGMAETIILLKPRAQWRKGLSWDDLVAELDAKLQYPGMPNIWWMPIQTRTEMLTTGVRTPLALQVFGDSIDKIQHVATQIEQQLRTIAQTQSVFAERSTGGFYLDINIDRHKAARYALNAADITQNIHAALGGINAPTFFDTRRRFAVNVRYAREYRDDVQQIGRILIDTPKGLTIPLSQVAELKFVNGPPMIRSEDGQLVALVFIDPGTNAISEFVTTANNLIKEKITLPPEVRLESSA